MSSQCIQKEVVYTKKVGESLLVNLFLRKTKLRPWGSTRYAGTTPGACRLTPSTPSMLSCVFQTLRIESSKYQTEKKSTEILEVVVSETRLV